MKNKDNKIVNFFEKTDNKNHSELIEKLYKEQYTNFYKIAYSILQNDTDAKDAVHESFLKSYKYMNTISEKKCPEIISYFVYIVKSVSINMKKSQAKIILSKTSDDLIDRVHFTDGSDVILEKMIKNQCLNTLLDKLPKLERSILEYKVIDKLTFKEIGKKIDLSKEVSKKRYQRLLKKLKEKEERRC